MVYGMGRKLRKDALRTVAPAAAAFACAAAFCGCCKLLRPQDKLSCGWVGCCQELLFVHAFLTSDRRCLVAETVAAFLQPVGSLHAADTPFPAASTAMRRDPASGVRGLLLSLAAATPALATLTMLVLASSLRDEVVLVRVATVDTTCSSKRKHACQGYIAARLQHALYCVPWCVTIQSLRQQQPLYSLANTQIVV